MVLQICISVIKGSMIYVDWLLDEESRILQAFCSWGHVAKCFAKIVLYYGL